MLVLRSLTLIGSNLLDYILFEKQVCQKMKNT